MDVRYLNTDLDLESKQDLSELVLVLEANCCVLHAEHGEDSLWVIRAEPDRSEDSEMSEPNPVDDLDTLLRVLENLSDSVKNVLFHANLFDFNIGWQSFSSFPVSSFKVSPELLRRISALGASLSVTIYPTEEAYPDERPGSSPDSV